MDGVRGRAGSCAWFPSLGVLALGGREHHDLVRFPKIERRRAHQIADILDEQKSIRDGGQTIERGTDHRGIEVAALAGVDLYRRNASGADPLGVVRGLLIALDHRNWLLALQIGNGLDQQRGLAGARTRDEIQREHPCLREARAVDIGQIIVLAENIALDLDDAFLAQASDMHTGKAAATMDRLAGGVVGMRMVVIGVVMMIVEMVMIVRMVMIDRT